MEDTERIEALEQRLRQLEDKQIDLRAELADARIEAWKGRLDDLEVQAHLGGMQIRDRFGPIVEDLRSRLLDARADLSTGGDHVSDAATTIAEGVQAAFRDLVGSLRAARVELSEGVR